MDSDDSSSSDDSSFPDRSGDDDLKQSIIEIMIRLSQLKAMMNRPADTNDLVEAMRLHRDFGNSDEYDALSRTLKDHWNSGQVSKRWLNEQIVMTHARYNS